MGILQKTAIASTNLRFTFFRDSAAWLTELWGGPALPGQLAGAAGTPSRYGRSAA